MENKTNNGIFFLTLSFICIWIVIDSIWGKQFLDSFLSSVFPFYNGEGLKKINGEDVTIKDFTSPTQITENINTVVEDNVDKYKDTKDKLNKDLSNMTKEERLQLARDILLGGA